MARQEINGRPIIWRPQPRQAAFMRRSSDSRTDCGVVVRNSRPRVIASKWPRMTASTLPPTPAPEMLCVRKVTSGRVTFDIPRYSTLSS